MATAGRLKVIEGRFWGEMVVVVALSVLPATSAFAGAGGMARMPTPAKRTLVGRQHRPAPVLAGLRAVASIPDKEAPADEPARGAGVSPQVQSRAAKGKENLLLIQNGSFGLGAALVLAGSGTHIFTPGEDPAFVGRPLFRVTLRCLHQGVSRAS